MIIYFTGILPRQLFLMVILLLVAMQLLAVNVEYTVNAGVGYSDNISRIETNPLKDSIREIGGTLSVVDESSSNDFLLDMDLKYLDYKDDTFADDVIANIALASNFSLIDEALTWTLDGFYGQQTINAFSVITPNNLQDTGFLSTGPNFIIRFTSLDSLTLGYRYNDFYAEETLVDYQSDVLSMVLTRRLSSVHTLSVSASYDNLDYEDDSNIDFEDFRYSVIFGGSSPTTQYSLEWGIIDVEFDTGENLDNDLKRFSISRRLNSYNEVSVQLSESLENAARAAANTIPGTVTTGLFVSQIAQLGYSYDRGAVRLELASIYSDQDYVQQDSLDQKIVSNTFGLIYGSPTNLQTSFRYINLSRDFYDPGQDLVSKDTTIALSIEKRLTRNINIEGTYINFSRESTSQTQNINDDIEENRIIVTLRYLGRI